MNEWKQIKIDGIAKIEKRVAEFDIWELRHTPYARFKVKIVENVQGEFSGFTNIRIKDEMGNFYGAVGFGSSIEEALKDTLEYFLGILSRKNVWDEDDFELTDPYDW